MKMQELKQQVAQLVKNEDENTKNIRDLTSSVRELVNETKLLKSAFPEGDIYGHCLYHKAVIEEKEERKEFFRHLRKQVGIWFIIALLAWLGNIVLSAVWNEAAKHLPGIQRQQ